MFSRLVQAVHQFIILTGASSSHRLAKCGCTKKSRVAPSITRAGLLLVESAAPQLPGVTLQSIELRGKLAAQLLSPSTAALPAMAMVCSRRGSSLTCFLPVELACWECLAPCPAPCLAPCSAYWQCLGPYLAPFLAPCLTLCLAWCLPCSFSLSYSLPYSLPYSMHCSLPCSLP